MKSHHSRTRTIGLVAAALASFGIMSAPGALAQPNTNVSSMDIQQAVSLLQNSDVINFIQHANLAEMQGLKKAQDKLQTAKIKDMVQMMLQDHQNSSQDVARLAALLSIQIPDFQAASDEIASDNILEQLHGMAFEQAFVVKEKMDHSMVLNTLQQMQKMTLDPQIQKLITDIIPDLQKHLALLTG